METVSSEHDMMEASAEAISCSSLGKRKAEIQDLKDSGEMEKGGAPATTEITGSGSSSPTKTSAEDNPPYWGYNSFEGVEYSSLSEDELLDKESNEKTRRYRRQCIESQGFDVDRDNIPIGSIGAICQLRDLDLDRENVEPNFTLRQHMVERATRCLHKYNEQYGTNMQFDHIVKVNVRGCRYCKWYITFMAKDSPDGPLVEYQAKLAREEIMGEDRPVFCRPKPKRQGIAYDQVLEQKT